MGKLRNSWNVRDHRLCGTIGADCHLIATLRVIECAISNVDSVLEYFIYFRFRQSRQVNDCWQNWIRKLIYRWKTHCSIIGHISYNLSFLPVLNYFNRQFSMETLIFLLCIQKNINLMIIMQVKFIHLPFWLISFTNINCNNHWLQFFTFIYIFLKLKNSVLWTNAKYKLQIIESYQLSDKKFTSLQYYLEKITRLLNNY